MPTRAQLDEAIDREIAAHWYNPEAAARFDGEAQELFDAIQRDPDFYERGSQGRLSRYSSLEDIRALMASRMSAHEQARAGYLGEIPFRAK